MVENRFSIRQTETGRFLHISGALPAGFHGEPENDGWRCPLDTQNAAVIRHELP